LIRGHRTWNDLHGRHNYAHHFHVVPVDPVASQQLVVQGVADAVQAMGV
jgi:hypothetical protein